MNYSLNKLYRTIGISKQAVHRKIHRQTIFEKKLEVLLSEVESLRAVHPGCGVEKMYHTLQPRFIGRDKFIELFMRLGFRLKKRRNYRKTTIASKLYYPNIIKGLSIDSPNTIWQSDITYIEVGKRFYYAVFIIDVYTKEIVGYKVSDHMRATANVQALTEAIKQYGAPKIHHSDRGSQYIYKDYIALLKKHNAKISMGLIAQDNAFAERINRTIKEEYLSHWQIGSLAQLQRMVKKAVIHYNTKRIHNNIARKTPEYFRKYVVSLPKQERPMVDIYTDEKNKIEGVSNTPNFKQELPQAYNCPKKNEKQ